MAEGGLVVMRWSLLGRDDKQARRVACFLLLSLPCPPFRALGMEVRRCRVCSAVVVTADGSHELIPGLQHSVAQKKKKVCNLLGNTAGTRHY